LFTFDHNFEPETLESWSKALKTGTRA